MDTDTKGFDVSKDREADLAALLKAVMADDDLAPEAEPEPELPASEFAIQLGKGLGEAIASMRSEGIIEVEEASMEPLVAEVVEAGLDTKSPKQLINRVIKTLFDSDHVEEVYGSDSAISSSLKKLLGG